MREGDYYFGDKEMEIQTSQVHSIQTVLAQSAVISTLQWSPVHACMHPKSLQSCPTLCNPWKVACQALLLVGFSRQDTGVGCHALL